MSYHGFIKTNGNGNGRGLDLDVRGLLALISVLGLFGIVFMQLVTGKSVSIPPEVAGTVGAAIGFYFGGKGAADPAEKISVQGIQLDEIHRLINERLDKALVVIDEQRRELAREGARGG